MSTRASSLRSHDLRAPRRAPLRESNTATNVKEEVRIVAGQSNDAKLLVAPKTLSKSISSSPARRVPKSIATPAKRPAQSRKSISPVLQMESIQIENESKSPAKRNLGSPVRRPIPAKQPQVAELGASICNTSQALMQSFTKSLSKIDDSRNIRHTMSATVTNELSHSQSVKEKERCSPLKKAVRKPRTTVSNASETTSPLKKPPARPGPVSPPSLQASTSASVELSLSSSIDELTLPTPMKTNAKARSAEKRRSSPNQRTKSDHKLARSGFDEDELAAPTYTPIKSPYIAKYAQSPPTEENVMDDDDLWTPSVPLTLARSFSEMSLQDKQIITPLKEPAHTFFNDDGEVIIGKTLSVSPNHDQRTGNDRDVSSDPEVKVYVDCKSIDKTSSSEYFSSILSDLGAKTLCRWNWNPETQTTPRKQPRVGLTHVVFFGGAVRTLKKIKEARKLGVDVKCIGLSWVMQCKNSGRLTVGTDGHEIDVEAELMSITHSRRKSKESGSITTPTTPVDRPNALTPSEFLAPVDFRDETENVLSRSPDKILASARPGSSLATKALDKTLTLTDFEHRQLALARRNSAKFRPSISSPLSKKAWRA